VVAVLVVTWHTMIRLHRCVDFTRAGTGMSGFIYATKTPLIISYRCTCDLNIYLNYR